jgi:hypothetical protein
MHERAQAPTVSPIGSVENKVGLGEDVLQVAQQPRAIIVDKEGDDTAHPLSEDSTAEYRVREAWLLGSVDGS